MELGPGARAAEYGLTTFSVLASTNSEALARARAGDAAQHWFVAEKQTAGRGRRGRRWESPPGNLYASLLLINPCSPERAPQLSFVASLAIVEAVAALGPELGSRVRLKWPNDVLLDDAKVAGVLVEGERLADGRFATAIGIGVNCRASPADAHYPATSFAESGATITPEALFSELSDAMTERLSLWSRGDNFDAIRRDWLLRAARLGEQIALRTPTDVQGIFTGVDEQGRLLLRDASGAIETFTAGEISAPVPDTAGAGQQ